ncbi:hypothetical protein L1987_58018 [Smallanthus sonchifolius]|uniref:Uncharacterized protein n=1 Tax=Smallanthus sonchifolius TaxID=185202 RepID=A0ACB9DEM7_9ASTR|nr:hypothetical protein L1987_58018 [Smallanthus sonchifolius]
MLTTTHQHPISLVVHNLVTSVLILLKDRAVPSGLASVAQSTGQQITVGLAKNWIFDKITGKPNEVPSVGSGPNEVPSVGSDVSASFEVPSAGLVSLAVEEAGGGVLDAMMSGVMSIFESISS